MTQDLKLVIFDWDGTLFNSVGQIVASLAYAATQYEQPFDPELAKSVIGLGLPEVMQILFPNAADLQSDILQCYADHYVANSKNDAWFDGVDALLSQLQQQGLILAVATGKSRRGLDRVLNQTNSHARFAITRAASETQSKPHPQMLEEILSHTGLSPAQAIMVGDTSYDLEMAQRINMPRIAVSYGVHDIEVLQQFEPLFCAHNVADLSHYFASLSHLTCTGSKTKTIKP